MAQHEPKRLMQEMWEFRQTCIDLFAAVTRALKIEALLDILARGLRRIAQ